MTPLYKESTNDANATNNTSIRFNSCNSLTLFPRKNALRLFHTSKQAPRCGVDEKYFHDVAHNKSRQDEQRREDAHTKYANSPSSAPTTERSFL